MPRKKEISLQTIAARLGLTVHTVSKALRGLPGMSESTRRDIWQAARELGYRTKAQAAGLSAEQIPWVGAGKPRRFAMVMAGEGPFYSLQVEGLDRRLHELGHHLVSLVIPARLVGEQDLQEWLERSGVLYMDGLFLSPALPYWIEAALLHLPLPKVMINYPPDAVEVDSVIWDVQHAVHLAVNLLASHAHRRILFIGDIMAQRGFRLRWQSFQAACSRLGLPLQPNEQFTDIAANRTESPGMLGARLREADFTAIVCAVNEDVTWAMASLQAAGLSVPGDVSVIGMDSEVHPLYPDIARPVLLLKEAAERAAELMLRRIANPQLPFEHVRLAGSFLKGASVAAAGGIT